MDVRVFLLFMCLKYEGIKTMWVRRCSLCPYELPEWAQLLKSPHGPWAFFIDSLVLQLWNAPVSYQNKTWWKTWKRQPNTTCNYIGIGIITWVELWTRTHVVSCNKPKWATEYLQVKTSSQLLNNSQMFLDFFSKLILDTEKPVRQLIWHQKHHIFPTRPSSTENSYGSSACTGLKGSGALCFQSHKKQQRLLLDLDSASLCWFENKNQQQQQMINSECWSSTLHIWRGLSWATLINPPG